MKLSYGVCTLVTRGMYMHMCFRINFISQLQLLLLNRWCKWSFLFIQLLNTNICNRSTSFIEQPHRFPLLWLLLFYIQFHFYIYFVPPSVYRQWREGYKGKHEFFIFQIFFIIHVEQQYTPINSKTNAHINEGHFMVCLSPFYEYFLGLSEIGSLVERRIKNWILIKHDVQNCMCMCGV